MQTDDEALVKQLPGFSNGYAMVNGIRLHCVMGGSGAPLLLIPGWPETAALMIDFLKPAI